MQENILLFSLLRNNSNSRSLLSLASQFCDFAVEFFRTGHFWDCHFCALVRHEYVVVHGYVFTASFGGGETVY